ncbi:MAG: PAS domain-containing sensor histidine kinase [Raineya sp.]|jgi:PAS domain S-box-containing protein|nr:PAS domain-containing sensor histidine kinase [Raineya sp.]
MINQTTKVEDIFEQIIRKKLLIFAKKQQIYIFYVSLAIIALSLMVAFFSGVQNNITFYSVACVLPFISFAYWFFKQKESANIVLYYIFSNSIIMTGMLMMQISKLEVPEVFMILVASGYITIHLLVLVNTTHIIIEGVIAFVLFCLALQDNFTDTHAYYDSLLIIGSIIVAAFIAIQRYRMTQREIVAQTIIYHSNQKLHQQQQEISEQNKKIIDKEYNLRAIVDNSNMAIWLLDKNYKLVEFNEKFSQYMWTTYQESVDYGESFLDKMDKLPQTVFWKERFDRAFSGEKQTYIDFYPEFGNRYIQIELFPIIINHEIVGASIYGKNITKQKNAEITIQHNQQLLSSISKNIREGIYRSTPEGLVYANEAFMQLFGYVDEEIFSIKPSDFYADNKRREEIINKLLTTGFIDNEEVLFRKRDGTLFWALMSLIVQKDSEGNMHFDGAIRDITQTKEIKEQLEIQNEELKKINSELDRFVYSASHDLKAPLASILGLINVAKLENDPTAVFKYLEMMQHSIQKLDHFIKDIIDYSRNSRMEVVSQEVNLEEIIEEVYENLHYLEQASRIKKNIRIEQNVTFYSDSKRLLVVFNNLISNAINYHNLNQETPFIEIDIVVKPDKVHITVGDNGVGVGQEHLHRIFDMFYRASYDSKGSGLGLYIVKEAITKLNGQISVHSELGRGTKFFIILPNQMSSKSVTIKNGQSNEIPLEY